MVLEFFSEDVDKDYASLFSILLEYIALVNWDEAGSAEDPVREHESLLSVFRWVAKADLHLTPLTSSSRTTTTILYCCAPSVILVETTMIFAHPRPVNVTHLVNAKKSLENVSYNSSYSLELHAYHMT